MTREYNQSVIFCQQIILKRYIVRLIPEMKEVDISCQW
jgi:hypothetical protein